MSDTERNIAVDQPEWIVKIPDDGRRVIVIDATTSDSFAVETRDGLKHNR